MSLLVWILVFSLLGGVLSVSAAAVFLGLPQNWRLRMLPHQVSFAVGTLLGAAFLGLLPHAVEGAGVGHAHAVTTAVLLGLLGFFLLEKMVLWRHCHSTECEVHAPDPGHEHKAHAPAGTLILVGDSIHNFVDGVLIAAAFLTDVHLGIVTALAVAAHEIPQEVGDFAVLLDSGYSRAKAFTANILVSLTTLIGAVLAYFSLNEVREVLPYVLAVAASSFIYIAVADLIPGLHKRHHASAALQQVLLIALGVAVIAVVHSTLH